MAANSKIEWTDASWNPVRALNIETGKIGHHCEHVSEGCRFCYAEGMNRRLGTGLPYKPGVRGLGGAKVFLDPEKLLEPLSWKKPRMIFVCSMTDLFADFVTDETIDLVFAVMALCHRHTFQVLTKRPARMKTYMNHVEREARWMDSVASIIDRVPALMTVCNPIFGRREPWLPLPNVWHGVSAEDQKTADERIPELLATLAAVRFASLEPLLEKIDLGDHVWAHECHECFNGRTRVNGHFFDERCPACNGKGIEKPRLDWVIVGGESGPHARPMHSDWARKIRDDCAAAGVAYFFKQWGEWAPAPWKLQREPGETDNAYKARSEAIAATHGLARWGCAYKFDHAPWSIERSDLGGGPTHEGIRRVGKKSAGRILDGVEHNGLPDTPS